MGASQSEPVVLDTETPVPEENPFEDEPGEPGEPGEPCEEDSNPLNMAWFWPFM